ncbi:MAG: GHMP kinase [Candidatus Rokubacteria bacterium]|nr:GHMP kinase [Candidatus Rokubacteria bacterium]
MIISMVPLRVSLVGGGTDLPDYATRYGGAVLSLALDSYVYVVVKPMFDENVKVRYSIVENVSHADQLKHDIVRSCLKFHGIHNKIEIITTADLPTEGTGLGSSSAITVGLLQALYTYKGEAVSPDRLAQEACHVEIELAGSPIGKQDQYIAAYGGINRFDFHPDDTVTVTPAPLSPARRAELCQRLMLFYTGQTRSAKEILREQAANQERNLETLHQMKASVATAWEILTGARGLDEIGTLLDQAWQWKRRLAGSISNPWIDRTYDAVRGVSDAIGGKICGAGGGGFLLLYVPPEHQPRVREVLHDLPEVRVGLSPAGSRVIIVNGRGMLPASH